MALTPNITERTEQHAQALVAKYDQELAGHLSRHSTIQATIDLQVLLNKRNEAFEQLAAILRKQQEAQNAIINNMR